MMKNEKHDKAVVELNKVRQRALEHDLSRLNSRLSSSLEVLDSEVENLKGISGDIENIYEELGFFGGLDEEA